MSSAFKITRNGVIGSFTGSLLGTASNAISASYASESFSSSYAVSASYVVAAPFVTSASYDSDEKKIQFFNQASTEVASIDATDFIKDGMVDNVTIDTGSNQLIITFNTDSGKEDISLDLNKIFNPNNYYTRANLNPFTASVNSLNSKSGSWDAKWDYNATTIQGVKVNSASRADSAASADSATSASFATSASRAVSAASATSATSASMAVSASRAVSAASATSASRATSAAASDSTKMIDSGSNKVVYDPSGECFRFIFA